MGTLTYKNPDGTWGLKGVDWKAMTHLPPQVYGALCKLKDLEHPYEGEGGDAKKKEGVDMGWIRNRFCQVR